LRWRSLCGGVGALGVLCAVGCHETTSSAPADGAVEPLALWEERPLPPVGATIGVYVELGAGAPKGTFTLSSREARICTTLPAAADPGALAPDAGPPACPFEVALATDGGAERFVVVLVPVSATVPPLVAGVLVDGTNNVVSSVFRRFYYASPSDAGVPSDQAPATDAGDGGNSAVDADTNGDGATVEVGGQ